MITITPTKLHGTLAIQPSKSYLHRAILCAALSGQEVRIENVNQSEDILATLFGMQALGLADFELLHDAIRVFPMQEKPENGKTVDARESGSTLRFLIPLALSMGEYIRFTGSRRLLERPLIPYDQLCREQGFVFLQQPDEVGVCGHLQPGEYHMPGNLSSQFITGMLLALSRAGSSKIIIEGKIESLPYIKITLDVLTQFGVNCVMNGNVITIHGGYRHVPGVFTVPGDWSHAANFAVVGALSGGITLTGLSMDDQQGDRAILKLLQTMGAQFHIEQDGIRFEAAQLCATEIDVSQWPDLVPILTVALSLAQGSGRITNAHRLRLKESDRLSAIAREINAIGGKVTEGESELFIAGQPQLRGGTTHAHNDHRIAMAIAMASCFCKQPVTIDDEACVKKSAPDFWNEFQSLGGSYVCGESN